MVVKEKIKDITYYLIDNIAETNLADVVSSNSHTKFQFQELKNKNIDNETIKVNLSASQFKHISYNIFEVNDKWLKNLNIRNIMIEFVKHNFLNIIFD